MTKEEIIAFATQFDPQPFHIDEDAAKKSIYGGLIASGWHTVVNGGAKLVHPGGAKLVHLTLCGTRCWGVVPVVHRRDPRCFV